MGYIRKQTLMYSKHFVAYSYVFSIKNDMQKCQIHHMMDTNGGRWNPLTRSQSCWSATAAPKWTPNADVNYSGFS